MTQGEGGTKAKSPIVSVEKQEALLDKALETSQLAHDVILILMRTGMHINNLRNLVGKNVEHGEVLVWDRAKTRERIEITMDKDLQAAVSRFLQLPLKQRRRSRQFYYLLVRDVGKEAGLLDISPSTLRHTYIINEMRMGRTPAEMKALMGVSDKVLWRHYAKVRPEDRKEYLEKAEKKGVLTSTERKFVFEAKKRGYEVLRGGWPDFFVYKGVNGMAFLCEVKSSGQRLTPGQKQMARMFYDYFGVPVVRSGDGGWPKGDMKAGTVEFNPGALASLVEGYIEGMSERMKGLEDVLKDLKGRG